MKLPLLPKPIGTVVVPEQFHPSSFAQLERCPLSVLGFLRADASDLLVPHPSAFYGLILHHVRSEVIKGRWGTAGSSSEATANAFAAAVEDMEAALRSEESTAGLIPLHESVGRRAWRSRQRDLERWAERIDVGGTSQPARRLSIAGCSSPSIPSDETTAGIGSEQLLSSAELRLRGRPDWTEHVDQDRVEVVDYKTGRIIDGNGDLLEEYVVQVQLYALMIEAAFPQARATPILEGVERHEVPWGDDERAIVSTRLREMTCELPAGARVEARKLARPGVHCCSCRLRPGCATYKAVAPEWWLDTRDNPRPVPLDVWGEVASARAHGEHVVVRLVDLAGRRVRIDRIGEVHGAGSLEEGDAAWFFDLEASEDLVQHGAMVQPRNFHEHAPGPRWRPARRLRMFSSRD